MGGGTSERTSRVTADHSIVQDCGDAREEDVREAFKVLEITDEELAEIRQPRAHRIRVAGMRRYPAWSHPTGDTRDGQTSNTRTKSRGQVQSASRSAPSRKGSCKILQAGAGKTTPTAVKAGLDDIACGLDVDHLQWIRPAQATCG